MGLASPILLDQSFQTARRFGVTGTPSAIRIDDAGRIDAPVALGAPGVLALLGVREHAGALDTIARMEVLESGARQTR